MKRFLCLHYSKSGLLARITLPCQFQRLDTYIYAFNNFLVTCRVDWRSWVNESVEFAADLYKLEKSYPSCRASASVLCRIHDASPGASFYTLDSLLIADWQRLQSMALIERFPATKPFSSAPFVRFTVALGAVQLSPALPENRSFPLYPWARRIHKTRLRFPDKFTDAANKAALQIAKSLGSRIIPQPSVASKTWSRSDAATTFPKLAGIKASGSSGSYAATRNFVNDPTFFANIIRAE